QHLRLERCACRRSRDRANRTAAGDTAAVRSAKSRSNVAGEREGNAVKLRDLLPAGATDARLGAIELAGVTADSRKVKPGFLFVAIAGTKADGAQFANQAAAGGAIAGAAGQRPA